MDKYAFNQGLKSKYNLAGNVWGQIQVYTDFSNVGGALAKALNADLTAGGNAMAEIQYFFAQIGFGAFSSAVKNWNDACWTYALQSNCVTRSVSDKQAMSNAKISFSNVNGKIRATYTMAVYINEISMATKGLIKNAQAVQDYIGGPYGIYANPAKMGAAAYVAAAQIKPQFSKFVSAFYYNPQNRPTVLATGTVGKATQQAK